MDQIILLIMLIAMPIVCAAAFVPKYSEGNHPSLTRKIIATVVSVAAVGFATLVVMIMFYFDNEKLYAYAVVATGVVVELIFIAFIWNLWRIKEVKVSVLALLVVSVLSFPSIATYNYYYENIFTMKEENTYLYNPARENSKAVNLDEPSILTFTEDVPRMNGATALYPIYASFAKAVYPEGIWEDYGYHGYLDYGGSDTVYDMIISGEADIAFAAYPSEQQLADAAANGVELQLTPIGSEAFVFFVNKANKIDNITIDQIKGIYSGEITNWSELGADNSEIKAFQRNKGSGSQSALERLMGETPIMEAPAEDYIDLMSGIVAIVADYKNYRNSIGYSFRFYTTTMFRNNRIKLLSVNGVYPSEENIRNGTYPLTSNFYAVTTQNATENTKKLVDWILSEQGQEIIEKVGYTPIKE